MVVHKVCGTVQWKTILKFIQFFIISISHESYDDPHIIFKWILGKHENLHWLTDLHMEANIYIRFYIKNNLSQNVTLKFHLIIFKHFYMFMIYLIFMNVIFLF